MRLMLANEPSRRCAAQVLGLILLLTAALYAPSLRNGFTYDDPYVAASTHPSGRPNPMVAEPRPLFDYFRAHYWKGEHEARVEYRPVTIASYALTYRALGRSVASEALPQHALNLLLHLLATALVYRMLRAVRAGRRASLLGALVFGLHAVHSEVVASVVGRAELLAFAFGAPALLLTLGRGRAWRGVAAAVLFFLAFGSKESALVWAPFLVAMWITRALQRDPTCGVGPALATGLKRAVLVSAVPLAAFLALRATVLGALPQPLPVASFDANSLAYVPWLERVLSGVMIQGVAVGKILWPFHLVSDYGRAVFTLVRSLLDPRFLFAAAILAAIGVGGIASLRRRPLVFLAAAAFLGFSFVTSNLVVVIGTIFGERLLYAPSLALSFALAAWHGLPAAAARGRPLALAAALAIVLWLCAGSAVILQRNAAWRSDAALYTTDAATQPRSVKLNVLAADVYRERGETERQFEHLSRAVALDRQPARSWLRLALFFLQQRSWAEAGEAARRGAEAATGRAEAYRFQLAWVRAEALRASGSVEAGPSLWDEVLTEYRILSESPGLVDVVLNAPPRVGPEARAWSDVAAALEASGAPGEAEDALQLGVAACRGLPPAQCFPLHWRLAAMLGRSGRFEQMTAQLAAARSADPQRYERQMGALSLGDPRRGD